MNGNYFENEQVRRVSVSFSIPDEIYDYLYKESKETDFYVPMTDFLWQKLNSMNAAQWREAAETYEVDSSESICNANGHTISINKQPRVFQTRFRNTCKKNHWYINKLCKAATLYYFDEILGVFDSSNFKRDRVVYTKNVNMNKQLYDTVLKVRGRYCSKNNVKITIGQFVLKLLIKEIVLPNNVRSRVKHLSDVSYTVTATKRFTKHVSIAVRESQYMKYESYNFNCKTIRAALVKALLAE